MLCAVNPAPRSIVVVFVLSCGGAVAHLNEIQSKAFIYSVQTEISSTLFPTEEMLIVTYRH